MRLSKPEQFRRTLDDITERNSRVGRTGPVWSESCRCPGGYNARSLYGHAMVGVASAVLEEQGTMAGPCPDVCGFVRDSLAALRDAPSVDYRKLRRFLGRKLAMAGLPDPVEIGVTTINARLAYTVLRRLDAKRVRVAATNDRLVSSLHLGDVDGSWVALIGGMVAGPEQPPANRRAVVADLAGRRKTACRGR